MGRYSNYKQSSYDWLGRVPQHWDEKFLEQTASEKCVKNSRNTVKQVLSLSYGEIKKKNNLNKGLIAQDLSTYQIVEPGDIIMRLTDLQNDHKSLRTGIVKNKGIITAAYLCLCPKINPEYLHYTLRAYDVKKVFYGMGGGVRQSIGFKDVRHMYVPVPPRAEQDQIVRFLDWKVSEINRLIRIKKNQINGYREYEKKVINDKVLYGLQEAPLRESGNYWVGKIPTNWKIIKLGKFCSFQNGISESGNFFTSGTPFVGYSDVYRHLEIPKYVKGVAKANEQQQEIFSVRKGDIFFTRTSESIEEIGMAAVCKHTIKDAVFSGFLIRCRPRMPLINEDYMKYYLQIPAVRNHFSSMMNIVIRASLGQNLLKQMPVVVPPLKEQKEIAEFLDAMHERFLRLITTNEEEISMLEVLRSTLISDVVTGKIDVRNIPVPAYEHVDGMVADDGEDNDEETGIPGEED
jgi:type I restriction enzyme S subunit